MIPEEVITHEVSSFLSFRQLLLHANSRLFFRALLIQARSRRQEVLAQIASCPVLYSKLRGTFSSKEETLLLEQCLGNGNMPLIRVITSIRGPSPLLSSMVPSRVSMIDLIAYDPRSFYWLIPQLYLGSFPSLRPDQSIDSLLATLRLLSRIKGTLYQRLVDETVSRSPLRDLLTDSSGRSFLRLFLGRDISTLGRRWRREERLLLDDPDIRRQTSELLELI